MTTEDHALGAMHSPSGPLAGLRIIEFGAIGPVPFAGMLLSDLGADVVRIDRPGTAPDHRHAVNRGRYSLDADLKTQTGRDTAFALCGQADILMEGFRPGVMERLGLGPEHVLAANPSLIFGRMTGWGQTGPLADRAGHDINYIAISGALAAIGDAQAPVPPLNLVGDYGGGALYFVMSLLAALEERRRSGRGQVVDVAMCDGAASLMSVHGSMIDFADWSPTRSDNLIDGGAPHYRTYRCKDGRFIAVGPLERPFHDELMKIIGLPAISEEQMADKPSWPAMHMRMEEVFATRTSEEWCALLDGTDACFAPVLSVSEAPDHPQYRERGSFIERHGVRQPAPVPRYSRSVCRIAPDRLSVSPSDILEDWASSGLEATASAGGRKV